jgi:hypothetical protein
LQEEFWDPAQTAQLIVQVKTTTKHPDRQDLNPQSDTKTLSKMEFYQAPPPNSSAASLSFEPFGMLQVDLLVAVQALPLQALSLLVLPLPWSLPRLLKLQLAAPISLFEGKRVLQAGLTPAPTTLVINQLGHSFK